MNLNYSQVEQQYIPLPLSLSISFLFVLFHFYNLHLIKTWKCAEKESTRQIKIHSKTETGALQMLK